MRNACVRPCGAVPWALLALGWFLAAPAEAQLLTSGLPPGPVPTVTAPNLEPMPLDERRGFRVARARLDDDFAMMRRFRPGFAFWRHIFTIPDGSVAFGNAEDGRLVATFPTRGDWSRDASWQDAQLAGVFEGVQIDGPLDRRRERVASLLGVVAGPVLHNPTRGDFLLPNVGRYGTFLSEWGRIYERFGVPGEIGIAQAMLESGLDGRIRSEARALGFCQWLPENWNRMKRLAHHVIEGYNQTTQAAYCAAYLTILATKYGSFIPALSEHHAGGTNVARTVINGGRLGGEDIREQYFLGSQLALDLRELPGRAYRDVYGTYGPRSFRYAEMIFGNTANVKEFQQSVPQQRIHAMRARRTLSLAEIRRRTGLTTAEIRRYNPALVRSVPAGADLYLPEYVESIGRDVAFWHRPAPADYAEVLNDFLRLDAPIDDWHDPAYEGVLRSFQRRFAETGSEEGHVMATVLAYTIAEMYSGRRVEILNEYATSEHIKQLLEQGLREREALESVSSADR